MYMQSAILHFAYYNYYWTLNFISRRPRTFLLLFYTFTLRGPKSDTEGFENSVEHFKQKRFQLHSDLNVFLNV